jgi:hypothetical protein
MLRWTHQGQSLVPRLLLVFLPLHLVGTLLLHRIFFLVVREGLRHERILGRSKEEEVRASVRRGGH